MTTRDRRALMIGAGVILAALVLTRLLPAAVRQWREGRESLLTERELLARAELAIADLDGLEARAAATRSALLGMAPRLLNGRTEAEAIADLNGRLALAGGRQRTRLLRTDQVADSHRVGRLREVRLRVEVESDWSGLTGFLRAVSADPAVLRLRSVAIRGPEAPVGGGGPEVLSGEVEFSGWYLQGAMLLAMAEGE